MYRFATSFWISIRTPSPQGLSVAPLLHELDDELVKYYMVSANPSLGQVELLGYASLSPRLVNEGDLDGNGTSEVGYLPMWRMSQWRIYHLFTFKDGTWKYLIDPEAEVRDADGGESLYKRSD